MIEDWTKKKAKRLRKMYPGAVIGELQEVADATISGHWIFWRGRGYHPAFIQSLQFRVVNQLVRRGSLRYAMSAADPSGHTHYVSKA